MDDELMEKIDDLCEAIEGLLREHDNNCRFHSATGGEEWPDSEAVERARVSLAKARGRIKAPPNLWEE